LVISEKDKDLIKSDHQSLMLVKLFSKSKVFQHTYIINDYRNGKNTTSLFYYTKTLQVLFSVVTLGITMNDKPSLSENKTLISMLKLS